MGVSGRYEPSAAMLKTSCAVLEEKAGTTGGKSNRVLHTNQLPKKREMGFAGMPREDYRVRFTDKEIGLGNTNRGRSSFKNRVPTRLRRIPVGRRAIGS